MNLLARGLPIVVFTLLLVTGPATAQTSAEFYVSLSGKDGNQGSITEPFATFTRARQAVWQARSSGQKGDITVWIREGVYERNETLAFDQRDSGTRNGRTVFRAFPDEEVRIIGGRMIAGNTVRLLAPSELTDRVTGVDSRQNMRVVDLKALGLTNPGSLRQYGHGQPVVPAPVELFFQREALTIARYPNEGAMRIGNVRDPGSVPRTGDYSNRGAVFEYTDDRHERWAGAKDVWLQGTFMWGYADDMIRVAEINTANRTVTLSGPHMYGVGTGAPYRQYIAVNLLEELDQPGEYVVDTDEATLYFWPPAALDDAELSISVLEDPIIALEHVSWFTLQDVVIEFGRGMGIYLEGGEENLIAGCTIRNVGTLGIQMGQGARQTVMGIRHDDYQGEPLSRQTGSLATHLYHHTTWNRNSGFRHRIISNDVYNTGAGGIYLSGGDKGSLTPGEAVAENNRTWNNQRRNKFLWSGIIVDGVGNRVAHNEVFDSDYQGIMVRGGEHVFEYNYVHDIATDSDDTSPWYTGRDPSDRGNIVRYNFFQRVGRPDRMVMGVYLDDGTSGTLVHGNVLDRVASYGSVYSNSGSDNIITNNIFINGYGPALHIKSMWFSWAIPHIPAYWNEGGIYRHRLLEEVDIRKPPYSTRYPELVDFFDLLPDGTTYKGMIPRRNVFARNLVVRYEETVRLDNTNIELDITDNYSTGADPGFVDEANGNYALRPDAIVYDKIPGFERIPFEKIGIYQDAYRTRKSINKRP